MTPTVITITPATIGRRAWLKVGLSILAAGALSACGFRLRGDLPQLAFEQVQFRGSMGLVSAALTQALATRGIARVDALTATNSAGDAPEQRGVLLAVSSDQRERTVVGSTIAGQVRELNLRITFSWQALDMAGGVSARPDMAGRALTPPADIVLDQDMSYQESATLSKQLEQDVIFDNLQARVVQQVVRSLSAVMLQRQP